MKSQILLGATASILAISTSAFADYNHPHSFGGVPASVSFSTLGFTTGASVTAKGSVSESFYSGSYYKTLANTEETVSATLLNKNFPVAYMGTYGMGLVYSPDSTGAKTYALVGGNLKIMNNVVFNPSFSSYGVAANASTESTTSQNRGTDDWGSSSYQTTAFDSGWVPIYSIFIFEVDVLASVGGNVFYGPAGRGTAQTNCLGTVSTQGGTSCYNWGHTTTAYANNYATAALTGTAAARVGVSVGVAGAHAGVTATIDLLKATSNYSTNANNVGATSVYMGPHTWYWSGTANDTFSTLSGSFHVWATVDTIVGNVYSKDWTAFSWSGLSFPLSNLSMSGSEQI